MAFPDYSYTVHHFFLTFLTFLSILQIVLHHVHNQICLYLHLVYQDVINNFSYIYTKLHGVDV
jgi:hypothetical protein